jgi:hypothetical protein
VSNCEIKHGFFLSTPAGKPFHFQIRPYQELESKVRAVRSRHIRLAELVALDVAVENDDPELAPWDIRRKAIKLAIAVLMNNLRQK